MYNTTAEYKRVVQDLPQNYSMKIIAEFSESSSINLESENGKILYTEDNIILECENSNNGVSIMPQDIFDADFDESAFGISGFQIGSAAATMFSVRIHNENEKFSKNELSSAVLKPQITLYDTDGKVVESVKVGTFFTRNIIVSGAELKLDCSDRMEDAGEIPYIPFKTPCSLYEICTHIASSLYSSFANTADDLPILSKVIDDSVFDGYSLRQVISLIAEATGSFAIFNYDGELELKWFTESKIELREDWSKKAIVLNGNTFTTDGNPVKVTGVAVISGEESKAFVGTDEYLIEIVDNPIADAFPEETAEAVYSRLKDTLYIPSVWDRIGGDPSIQVGDIVTVIDNKEPYNPEHYSEYNKYKLYVSQKNWKYNGGFSESYEAQALPKQNKNKGMTVSKQLTRLAKQIEETEENVTSEMDRRQLALLMFNSAIAGSMGLYQTVITDENGGGIVYYHDKPNLSDSKIIYTYGSNGYAWTDTGWKGDATIWKYGFDKNGNAILNAIYAYTLSADVITSGLLKSKNGSSWINLDDGTFSFGKKSLFGLLTVPMLSLDADGYISMFGRIRSQLDKDLSFGYWGSGISIRDDSKAIGSKERFAIDVSSNSASISAGAAGDKLAVGKWRRIDFENDYIWIRHGHFTFSYASLELGAKDNSFNSGYFDLTVDKRKGIKADSSGKVALYNAVSHSAYLDTDGTFYIENIDIISDRDKKENITSQNSIKALDKIGNLNFYSYDLKALDDEKKNRAKSNTDTDDSTSSALSNEQTEVEKPTVHIDLGIMTDEAPEEILSPDGKHINLYSYISLTAKAVKELTETVKSQAKEIAALKKEIQKIKEEKSNENI